MGARSIPQRELRNNVGRILREAEAGAEFTITVRGRQVARLGPADQPRAPRVDVDLATVRAVLAGTPVDRQFIDDLEQIRRREEPVDDPWPNV